MIGRRGFLTSLLAPIAASIAVTLAKKHGGTVSGQDEGIELHYGPRASEDLPAYSLVQFDGEKVRRVFEEDALVQEWVSRRPDGIDGEWVTFIRERR